MAWGVARYAPATYMKDYLYLHLRDLPYFRALLRSVEATYYQDFDLPAPILDLGCGDGHFAQLTFDHPIDVGLDPRHAPIQEAGTRNVYRLLIEADGSKIPCPDGVFSSAFSNSVLEHIAPVEQVLTEMARVLRPGALFVFCVQNHHFIDYLSVAVMMDKIRLTSLAKLYRAFFTRIARLCHLDNPQVWQTRLEQAGFVLERWWHYFPPKALAILEWGHYFGLPSLILHKLIGRWVLVSTRWNLGLIYRFLKPYANAAACDDGVCTFYIARRIGE